MWLEPTSASPISSVDLTPNLFDNTIRVRVFAHGDATGHTVLAEALDGGTAVGSATGGFAGFAVPVPNARRWTPEVLFYGKGGDIATNRRDRQELSVACPHVLQAAVAYVNTLLVRDVLAEPAWADALTAEDRRGLTPLFWTHAPRMAR